LKGKSLILNKKNFLIFVFLIFLNFNTFCELYDTDEVLLFKKKAEFVIKKLEEKNISSGQDNIRSIDEKMKILEIINYFGEAFEKLEKKNFEEVRNLLSKISDILDTLEYKKDIIKVLDQKLLFVSENRICVEVKLKNISQKFVENGKMKVVLKDSGGNIVIEKIFSFMISILKQNHEIIERFYFYNIKNPEIIKNAEVEFINSME